MKRSILKLEKLEVDIIFKISIILINDKAVTLDFEKIIIL
jgi:hypothetical protein